MGTFLTIIIILGCAGLILFILVQNPKGGGLNSEFGSAVQLGGARRATDILEKGTWGIAIGIAVLCLFLAKDVEVVTPTDEIENIESSSDAVDTEQPVGGEENPVGNGPVIPQ